MSTGSEIIEDVVEDAAVSLEQRMKASRDAKEEATTEDFAVPGWGSLLWVRLRVIGYKAQRRAVEKNRRHRDRSTLDLYVASDILIAATDGFYEVDAKDGETLHPTETNWVRLAKGVYDMAPETTPRQALLRLIGDERVVPFYGEYLEWLNSERERIGQEQREDFPVTG